MSQIKLKNVRLSYPRLSVPEVFKGGAGSDPAAKPRYSATLLIPKSDTEQVQLLKNALMEVAVAEWKDKGADELRRLFATNKVCLIDGDVVGTEGYEGMYGLRTSSQEEYPPTLVDKYAKQVDNAKDGKMFYAGCYVNAIVGLWAQNNAYGKRLNCRIEGVQFFRDGDAFSGVKPVTAADFEPLEAVDAFEEYETAGAAAPEPAKAAVGGLSDFI